MERFSSKKAYFWLLLSLLAFSISAAAQSVVHLPTIVVTGSESAGTSSIPNSLAVLDLVSTTKGMLPPRMTTTQMNAISSPPEALSIYNTTNHAPEFYNGSSWIQLGNFTSPLTTLGDTLYENSTPAAARLAGNTTTTKNFLTQTGTGSASASPAWGTILSTDVPTLNQNTTGTALNITATSNTSLTSLANLATVGTITSGTWTGTTIAIANGGTGQTSAANAINALLPSQSGNSGLFLTTNGSVASWASGGGGGGTPTVTSQSSTYSVPAANYTVNLSGASFTVTLPTAVSAGSAPICLANMGSGLTQQYAIATTSAQTVAGLASGAYILTTPGEQLCVYSDNANWQIFSHTTGLNIQSAGTAVISATSAYTFTIPSSSIIIGSTYTNNSCTYIVTATTSSSTTITATGTCAPATSGTLTCVTCSPSGNLAFSARTVTGVPAKGATSTDLVSWYRAGHYAVVKYNYAQSGTGSAGTGDYIFFLPAGMVVDTSLIPIYNTAGTLNSVVAAMTSTIQTNGGWVVSGGSGNNSANAVLYMASTSASLSAFKLNMFYWISGGTASVGNQSASVFQFSAASLAWNFTITVPVSGWQP